MSTETTNPFEQMRSQQGPTAEQKKALETTFKTSNGQIPTESELAIFWATVERIGLDPFARQIYLLPQFSYGSYKWTAAASIDGLRVVAERSDDYAGQLGPYWCGPDGEWKIGPNGTPLPWLAKEPPAAAMVGVLRKTFDEPIWGIARYDAYVQKNKQGKPSGWWEKGPDHMTAKCAEALGLRRAYPTLLAGIYTDDELKQADDDEPKAKTETKAKADTTTRAQKPPKAEEPKQEAPSEPVPTEEGAAAPAEQAKEDAPSDPAPEKDTVPEAELDVARDVLAELALHDAEIWGREALLANCEASFGRPVEGIEELAPSEFKRVMDAAQKQLAAYKEQAARDA